MGRNKLSFRLLIAGFPFAAKTGTLCALVDAGYTLRYLNIDNKVHPLFAYGKTSAADKKKRVQIVDCFDQMQVTKDGKVRVKGGAAGLRAWTTVCDALDKWPVDGSDPSKWGEKDVLVMDSLTECALGYARRLQVLNNREDRPRFEYDDFTGTQKAMDGLMTTFKTAFPRTPVVVIGHLQLSGPNMNAPDVPGDQKSEEVQGMKRAIMQEKLNGAALIPWKMGIVTLGQAQSLKLGRHYDAAVLVKDSGGRGRKIYTSPEDGFDAGVPVPGIAAELPIETGLATIFEGMQKLKGR